MTIKKTPASAPRYKTVYIIVVISSNGIIIIIVVEITRRQHVLGQGLTEPPPTADSRPTTPCD